MGTIDELTTFISRLYLDHKNVEEAVESMRGFDISAELVKAIYTQLSNEVDELRDRFYYYYTNEVDKYWLNYRVGYWTSRYLLIEEAVSDKSAFHEIKIIDLFNDKSM
jgi:hypothetical protein